MTVGEDLFHTVSYCVINIYREKILCYIISSVLRCIRIVSNEFTSTSIILSSRKFQSQPQEKSLLGGSGRWNVNGWQLFQSHSTFSGGRTKIAKTKRLLQALVHHGNLLLLQQLSLEAIA